MKKLTAFLLLFSFLFQQSGLAYTVAAIPPSDYFRPTHLRSVSYDELNGELRFLIDKGDTKELNPLSLEQSSQRLLRYFLVGIALPENRFWVNLRPDSPDQVIDPSLARTDIGRVMLEADVQLKKDTARFTSPQTSEGKQYWDKLYKKAEEIFGPTVAGIPTLTRPWIVPDEIIVRESSDGAFIYKATMKVVLEQDHLKDSAAYNFKDERQAALNAYSSQLLRQQIIPKLSREINSSGRYAELRRVFYALVLAHWFKERYRGETGRYADRIDSGKLEDIGSEQAWDTKDYYAAYKQSFTQGEYSARKQVVTFSGPSIRTYFSGGVVIEVDKPYGKSRIGARGRRSSERSLPAVLGDVLVAARADQGRAPTLVLTKEPAGAVAVAAPISGPKKDGGMTYEEVSDFVEALKHDKYDEAEVKVARLSDEDLVKVAQIFSFRYPGHGTNYFVLEALIDSRNISPSITGYQSEAARLTEVDFFGSGTFEGHEELNVPGKIIKDLTAMGYLDARGYFTDKDPAKLESAMAELPEEERIYNRSMTDWVRMLMYRKKRISQSGIVRAIDAKKSAGEFKEEEYIKRPIYILPFNKAYKRTGELFEQFGMESRNMAELRDRMSQEPDLSEEDRQLLFLLKEIGKVDEQKYTWENFIKYENGAVAVQVSDNRLDLYIINADALKKYTLVDAETVTTKLNPRLYNDLPRELRDMFKAWEVKGGMKTDVTKMIRISDLGIPIAPELAIEREAGTQYKHAGEDGFLLFDDRKNSYYLCNVDSEGLPMSYMRTDGGLPVKETTPWAINGKAAFGGIDFRELPVTHERVTGLFDEIISIASARTVDIDKEISSLSRMAKACIFPSAGRLKELVAACYRKGELAARSGELLGCLALMLREQERRGQPTEAEQRELLVLLEIL